MPIVDDYLLGRSSEFPLAEAQEQRTDLTLTQSAASTGRVRGEVTNSVDGSPVVGAVVKLYTQNGDPVDHTVTNASGNYIIGDIPAPGTYTLSVMMDGFVTSLGQTFTILGGQTLDINVALTPDTRYQNVVYGVVTDQVTGDPIDGALVALAPNLPSPDNISVVRSNADGEYLITDIPDSTQTLVSQAGGYYESSLVPIIISGGSLIRSDIVLQPYTLPQGTVNGYVTNQAQEPITNAFVGLYAINGQGTEILEQVTFTDENGFYIFGRSASGNYVVKSKLEMVVTEI